MSGEGEYDHAMVTLLELVWGDGFLSPGGPEEVARLLEGSSVEGARVLDIGCGIGGVDLLLARDHGARHVLGIDIDPSLVARAVARAQAQGMAGRVDFEVVKPGILPFPGGSFDVVFSKDAMVQIPDKPALFAEVMRVLTPNGRFIASDWLKGRPGPYSPAMRAFFKLEGLTYNMATPATYRAALARAGFVDIRLDDRNAWYREVARREWQAMQDGLKDRMVELLGPAKHAHFVANWGAMVAVLDTGELRPAHLKARRPG